MLRLIVLSFLVSACAPSIQFVITSEDGGVQDAVANQDATTVGDSSVDAGADATADSTAGFDAMVGLDAMVGPDGEVTTDSGTATYRWRLVELSGNGNILAVATDHTVLQGELSGTPTSYRVPNVTQLSASEHHACAVLDGGSVACWGSSTDGQAGPPLSVGAPTVLSGVMGVEQVTTGDNSTLLLKSSGSVLTMGLPAGGLHRLGPGYPAAQADDLPTLVVAVASGRNTNCILRRDGDVWCWGRRVGDGTDTNRIAAVLVRGINDAVAMDVGSRHACVVHTSGDVSCWGENEYGQTGIGSYQPARLGLTDVVEVALGDFHTCGRRRDGSVFCFGREDKRARRGDFQTIAGVRARALTANAGGTCAVQVDGPIVCWGSGSGFTELPSTPVFLRE